MKDNFSLSSFHQKKQDSNIVLAAKNIAVVLNVCIQKDGWTDVNDGPVTNLLILFHCQNSENRTDLSEASVMNIVGNIQDFWQQNVRDCSARNIVPVKVPFSPPKIKMLNSLHTLCPSFVVLPQNQQTKICIRAFQ